MNVGDTFYIPKDWAQLAYVDEGEDYTVDAHGIYKTAVGGFALVGASGCSCWDGDFEFQGEFATLDDLEAAVTNPGNDYYYHPSDLTLKHLLEEARSSV